MTARTPVPDEQLHEMIRQSIRIRRWYWEKQTHPRVPPRLYAEVAVRQLAELLDPEGAER